MTAQPLTCREFVELVTDYLEGALPPEDRKRFEDHLGLCDGCNIYLEQMRQTIRLMGKVTEESIPLEAQEQLLAAFRQWKDEQGSADANGP
jgi:anti-sigma factor RsiW